VNPGTTSTDEQLFATFYVDGAYYGVNALDVQEVLRFQPMTRVPLSPPEVSGLINLRGQIVTALDLRVRLGLPPLDDGLDPMNVVVRTDDGPVSLLADEIGDVIEVPVANLEPPPATVSELEREVISGIHSLEDRLLLILDVARISAPIEVNGD
jgi:purine-binding chemotaxis protein CheW